MPAAANVIQRSSEAADQRHRRGERRLALDLRLALLAQVEVEARLASSVFHALPGALAHAEVGQAGRNHDGLLRAADEDVDAPAVHVEVGGAEAGDAVHDEQRVGAFQQRGHALHVMTRAGRGFGRLHVEHARAVKLRLHFAQIEGLAVGNAQQLDLTGR